MSYATDKIVRLEKEIKELRKLGEQVLNVAAFFQMSKRIVAGSHESAQAKLLADVGYQLRDG